MEGLNHFISGAFDILLQNGLAGVVIGVLFLTVRSLYKRNCAVQDARIVDAQTQTNALNANTNALQRMSDALLQGENKSH